ncbi:unnamed protein product, partial [Prunus brigantina]
GGGGEDSSEGGGLWSHGEWVEKKTQGRGESPYSLTFGCEVVLPPEMEIPTLHMFVADSCKNDELLSRDLDLAEEFRDRALARLKNYQMKVKRSYDKKLVVSLSNTTKAFSKSLFCLAVQQEPEIVEDIPLDVIKNGILRRKGDLE